MASETAEARAFFVSEPGKGQLVEQALAERATLAGYGADTSGPDKRLAGLGWPPPSRAQAAAERSQAAQDDAEDGEGSETKAARSRPPAGRTAPPRAAG